MLLAGPSSCCDSDPTCLVNWCDDPGYDACPVLALRSWIVYYVLR